MTSEWPATPVREQLDQHPPTLDATHRPAGTQPPPLPHYLLLQHLPPAACSTAAGRSPAVIGRGHAPACRRKHCLGDGTSLLAKGRRRQVLQPSSAHFKMPHRIPNEAPARLQRLAALPQPQPRAVGPEQRRPAQRVARPAAPAALLAAAPRRRRRAVRAHSPLSK